jgi:hypothetical protein
MRPLLEEDRSILEQSLANDPYHKDTTADFFYEVGSASRMYMDKDGPVFVLRGTPALRLDMQFLNNEDILRNATTMLAYIDHLVASAQSSGFKEIIFQTDNPKLKQFCAKRMGFTESSGEMVKAI